MADSTKTIDDLAEWMGWHKEWPALYCSKGIGVMTQQDRLTPAGAVAVLEVLRDETRPFLELTLFSSRGKDADFVISGICYEVQGDFCTAVLAAALQWLERQK